MTRKQADVLKFIADFMASSGGVSPSLSQIAAGIGTSSRGSAQRYINLLEEGGFIRRTKDRKCSIQIIDPGEVKLNTEIFQLVQRYAKGHDIGVDTAANELLRQVLGAAA